MALARFVFKEQVEDCLLKRFKSIYAIDKAINTEGLKFIVLLRLNLMIPFNLLNFFMGLTDITFKHYALGCFAMIPGTFAFVISGVYIHTLVVAATNNDISGEKTQ